MDVLESLPEWDPSALFRFVDVLGVLANALIGAMVARSMRFDAVGFLVLGIISGLGGGMIRDVLLQIGFPVALTDPLYLSSAVIASLVAFLIPLRGRLTDGVLNVADVLALGCWSATGAQKALGAGLDPLPAIMLGVITATGGGMLRDVLVGRTPSIFGGNTLYATLAVGGATIQVVAIRAGHRDTGMLLAILLVAVVGLLARWKGWSLPHAPEWDLEWRSVLPRRSRERLKQLTAPKPKRRRRGMRLPRNSAVRQDDDLTDSGL